MHVSIHKTQHTKNDVCIYVWRIYLWQNRNRQRTLLSVFLFPDPCEFLPTLPRYHQGAIDLRWLLRWTGCQRNSNIWQTDFVAIKGMKAELQLDEGTNMINMMRLYSLWGKILDLFELVATNIFQKSFDFGCFQGSSSCCESISAGSVVLSARKESNPPTSKLAWSPSMFINLANLWYLTNARYLQDQSFLWEDPPLFFFGTWESSMSIAINKYPIHMGCREDSFESFPKLELTK